MVQAIHSFDIYQPRNPKASAYYKYIENHFEELERAWDKINASLYEFWRTFIMNLTYKEIKTF